MRKRDALKLEPGQRVIYGDSMWTAEMTQWEGGKARQGEVLFVTPGGRNTGVQSMGQGGVGAVSPCDLRAGS
jgi:hypothetical protein